MNYEEIKTYAQRCDSHPDHQTGIITNQMIMDRLLDEIKELRDYIEVKRLPVSRLLVQSKQNHERIFGPSATADWIYSDLLEFLEENL